MSAIETKPKTGFLEYVLTVGISAMEGRGCYVPVDSAISNDGVLYVVNRSQVNVARGVRVMMCNAEGEYFGTFGSFGEGDGQFTSPSGIAIDSQGRIYVSDEHLHRISVFDAGGRFLSKFGSSGTQQGELDTPSGLALDSQDNIYVSDTYNNRIQKFTADGQFQSSFGSLDDGNGGLNLPWGVAVDAKQDVYVADWGNDRIQKFAPDGEHVATFGTSGDGDGEFYRPSGVAVDNDGFIYVSDWGNERVLVLDSEGRFVTSVMGDATLSKWAANFLSINVEEGAARSRANLEPEIDYFVPDSHEQSSHIEKYFWAPASIKLDGAGRLYVTESNRHRVQVYKRAS
jgi:sugar lactone lactonase YvrE